MKGFLLVWVALFIFMCCCGTSESSHHRKSSGKKIDKTTRALLALTPSLIGCGDVKINSPVDTHSFNVGRGSWTTQIKLVAWTAQCNYKTYHCSITIMGGSEKGGLASPTCIEKQEAE